MNNVLNNFTYTNIQGWSDDFLWLYYNQVVKEPQDKQSKFAEIGVWRGRSACYIGELIKLSGKNIKLFAIDTWAGSDEQFHKDYISSIGGPDALYNEFKTNMTNAGLNEIVIPIRLKSVVAATTINDKSLDFIFIDGSHEYQDVKDDILAWLPKLAPNGEIWGHDADWHLVQQALNEIWPNKWEKHGSCWKGLNENSN